jgi:polyisoprenoid-binding protein YceI
MPSGRDLAWRWMLASLAGLSAGATAPLPNPMPAQTAPMRIDPTNSEARFVVSLRIGMRTQGRIPKVSGEMGGDAKRGWQVLVVADGKSLVVKGPRWMDKATRSQDFLDIERHPEIRFQSDRFSDKLLHEGGSLGGRLTLRGLTRPVSFRLLPSGCAHPGRDCDLQVNGIINRKDFGMTAHPVSVRDDVELHMRVRLLAPAGASP